MTKSSWRIFQMKKAWFTLPIDELNVLGDLPFLGMVKYNVSNKFDRAKRGMLPERKFKKMEVEKNSINRKLKKRKNGR